MTEPITITIKPKLTANAVTAQVSVWRGGDGKDRIFREETRYFRVGHHPSKNGFHVQQGYQRRPEYPTVDWSRDARFPYCGKGDLARARAQGYVDSIARLGYAAAVAARDKEHAASVEAKANAEQARIEAQAGPLLGFTDEQWAAIQAWERVDGLVKAYVRDSREPDRVARRRRVTSLQRQHSDARWKAKDIERADAIQAEIDALVALGI